MRNLLVSAVLLFCLADLGYSYQCYTCKMAMDDQSCMQVSNCSGSAPFCGTVVVNAVVMTYINKFCSAACVSSSQNITVVSATETCCTSNLCNDRKIGNVNNFDFGNGASGLAGGSFLLVTITCLLGGLFKLNH